MEEVSARDIVLYPARSKMALLALGGLLFVLCAPVVWLTGGLLLRAVAVLDVLFFGFCTAFALGRLLHPRPSLVIDDVGVTDNASAIGAGLIRWEEIVGVEMTAMGTNRFLVLIVKDPEAVLARQPRYRRAAMRANVGMIGSPVAIPGHMTGSLEDVLRHIQSRLAEHGA